MSGFPAFRRIVWCALLAAALTGIAITLLQSLTTAPLIAKAEEYERAAAPHQDVAAAAGEPDHAHASSAARFTPGQQATLTAQWEPEEGFERIGYTALTTSLAAFGYALLLGAMLTLLGAAGLRAGLVLGAVGFAVFQLAPALGLPPEPPGVPSAALLPRQLWWLATVVATALAFACWYAARTGSRRLWLPAGLALIALPHLVGAPHAPVQPSAVPAELIHRFAWMAMLTALCFWLTLGALVGYLAERLNAAAKAAEPM